MNTAAVSPALPRVLSIAGTDPTGGAGIQADIKSITAADAFPYSVVTALVAQNTTGVQKIFTPPTDFLRTQLDSVFQDVEVDAVKIGMLGSAEIAQVVTEYVAKLSVPVILDPVMVASSGDRLLNPQAEAAVKELTQHATVITPNLPELAVLTGSATATDYDQAIEQAQQLAHDAQAHVLMKGGHFSGPQADNALVGPDSSVEHIPVARIDTRNTHGTGCSLSSALAGRIAAGHTPAQAARWATRWLHESIRYADDLHIGQGNGPIDHSHTARRMVRAAHTKPWRVPDCAVEPARLEPPGPNTCRLWEAGGRYLTQILALPFIQDLGSGELAREDFLFYLAQDAFYLRRYAQALTLLGGAWAEDAKNAIATEQEMQTTWLAGNEHYASGLLSPTTQAYTDFLVAATATDEAAVGQAAVLPCYWLYAEVGLHLADRIRPDHPYKSWLETYRDEAFLETTRAAIQRVEVAMAACPQEAGRAYRAFHVASRYEVDFFAQSDRAWVVEDA